MTVGVHGDGDRRVPKSLHHDPWAGALADQHRDVGMAKVVESKVFESNPFRRRTKDTTIEVRVTTNPPYLGVGEHLSAHGLPPWMQNPFSGTTRAPRVDSSHE